MCCTYSTVRIFWLLIPCVEYDVCKAEWEENMKMLKVLSSCGILIYISASRPSDTNSPTAGPAGLHRGHPASNSLLLWFARSEYHVEVPCGDLFVRGTVRDMSQTYFFHFQWKSWNIWESRWLLGPWGNRRFFIANVFAEHCCFSTEYFS